jgi:hypothetical protein
VLHLIHASYYHLICFCGIFCIKDRYLISGDHIIWSFEIWYFLMVNFFCTFKYCKIDEFALLDTCFIFQV